MNVLVDIIPAKYRKYAYAALTLASLVYGVWQATDGDWRSFAGGIFAALVGGLATSNTNAE